MIDEEAFPELVGESDPFIVIDGERMLVVSVDTDGYESANIETEYDGDYIVMPSSEIAGRMARERWEDTVDGDPEEFIAIVGEDTLIKWAMGRYAGPGSTQVRSLKEWLDLWLDTPEEEFATYDGEERECEANKALIEMLEFEPTVAYRTN